VTRTPPRGQRAFKSVLLKADWQPLLASGEQNEGPDHVGSLRCSNGEKAMTTVAGLAK
jgi:hypothetical protein